MKFFYIINDENFCQKLDDTELDYIWIDLEKNGKYERQKNMDSVKSNHSLEDIKKISPKLKNSKLLVRVNPIFDGSEYEINKAIEYGADTIMLPMFKTTQEVKKFFEIIAGRCSTILLLETKEAVENLEEIINSSKEIKNVHIGLNDLSISYGYKFMFESLANGIVEKICKVLKANNIDYGFGGIARLGEGALPAELILSEHIRLGSKQVILSRSFCRWENYKDVSDFIRDFQIELKKLKNYEKELKNLDEKKLEENNLFLKKTVENIILKDN